MQAVSTSLLTVDPGFASHLEMAGVGRTPDFCFVGRLEMAGVGRTPDFCVVGRLEMAGVGVRRISASLAILRWLAWAYAGIRHRQPS
jgi:hypothetical protein